MKVHPAILFLLVAAALAGAFAAGRLFTATAPTPPAVAQPAAGTPPPIPVPGVQVAEVPAPGGPLRIEGTASLLPSAPPPPTPPRQSATAPPAPAPTPPSR